MFLVWNRKMYNIFLVWKVVCLKFKNEKFFYDIYKSDRLDPIFHKKIHIYNIKFETSVISPSEKKTRRKVKDILTFFFLVIPVARRINASWYGQ